MAQCRRISELLSRTYLGLAVPCGAFPCPLWPPATFSRALPFCPVQPNQKEAGPGPLPPGNLVSKNSIGHFVSVIMLYPLHGSDPCCGKGACITQCSYEPHHAGPPKMDGSQWKVLTKCGPLEEGMADHSSILTMRTP